MKKSRPQRRTPHPGVSPRKRVPEAARRKFTGPPPHVMRYIAYAMIGLAVVASWFVTPIPVAVGFTLLAAFRLVFAWREERREKEREQTDSVCSIRG